MASAPDATPLPEEWRTVAAEVAAQEGLSTETLLADLARLSAAAEADFSRQWGDLVDALANAIFGLRRTPTLAAAFLRVEWEELATLATAMEGEPPPEEVSEGFRRAASEATDPERVVAIAESLHRAAAEIRDHGDLTSLHTLGRLGASSREEGLESPSPPAEGLGAASPPPLPPPNSAPVPPPVAAPPTILLVAGSTLRRLFLERQLTASGFVVQTADNPGEAVHWLSAGRYHALLVEPGLLTADLYSWAEHAGASRVWQLAPGGAFTGAGRPRDFFRTPPSDDEIERLRQGL